MGRSISNEIANTVFKLVKVANRQAENNNNVERKI